MRNYLFAPFEDDDHKIEEFNAVVNALNYVVDAEETHHHESALHGLRVFVGRLESYYDAIISKLQADNKSFHGQYDEIEELQAEKEKYRRDNKWLANRNGEIIKEKDAIIKELKADIKHDADVCYDVDDEHIKTINKLQAENNNLIDNNIKLEDKLNRLMEQVSSNRDSNSNTHTHITRDVNDYMNHHPEHSELRLFILPIEEFSEGDYNHSVYWDDGIEV